MNGREEACQGGRSQARFDIFAGFPGRSAWPSSENIFESTAAISPRNKP
jgi:hypothetical protein